MSIVAKTHFIVIHEKSIENMGIEPTWNDLPALRSALESVFDDIGAKHYSAICISAEGRYHVHVVLTFDKAKRTTAVAKLLGNCHVEDMRGTKEEAADYINKRGKYEEKGEKVLDVFGDINAIQNNSGKRTDLAIFDAAALADGFDITKYILEHTTSEREAQNLEKRFYRLLEANAASWRRVEVIYVEGETGSGKTRVAMEKYPNAFKASVSAKTNFPFNGYKGEKVLILDELRPGIFNPAELFQILDGYRMNIDVKYGCIPACWEKVIITTSMPLSDWFNSLQDVQGQDNLRKQFKRRIAAHKIAVNGTWRDYDEYQKERAFELPNSIDANPFKN